MSERLQRCLKLRNKREIGVGPLKGKNQLERLELSHTRGRSEGHSKRAGSHRGQRESSGRGRSPTRRRHFQAQKTTCRQEEVQCRRTWNHTYGQGRTLERSNNPEDTQPQRGPPGKNVPVAAGREEPPTEAPTPSGRI